MGDGQNVKRVKTWKRVERGLHDQNNVEKCNELAGEDAGAPRDSSTLKAQEAGGKKENGAN